MVKVMEEWQKKEEKGKVMEDWKRCRRRERRRKGQDGR